MFDLLYKEWRLAVHPTVYIFLVIGALVLVPAYPYGMVFFFGCLGLFFSSLFARENADLFYTALLPLSKAQAVRGKCLLFVTVQLTQLTLCLPFAVLRLRLLPAGNPVGIEANTAYFGFGLLAYAGFNLLFLPLLFGTGYQVGKAFLAAILPVLAILLLMEGLVHLPAFAWLDSVQAADQLRQLPILAAGLLIYPAANVLACHLAARAFARVDL